MKQNPKESEADALARFLNSKPEIDARIEFYKNNDVSYAKLIESIDVLLKTETDEYKQSKLEIERHDYSLKLFYTKNQLEDWSMRLANYHYHFSVLKQECDDNYDKIMEDANIVKESNLRLANELLKYVFTDEKTKVEFYLYVKQEVANHKKANKGKVALPKEPKLTVAN